MAAMTPDQIRKTFAKARAAQEAGQFPAAIQGYQRILRAAPNLAEVHYNLGMIAAAQGRIADGAQAFEAALKLKPAEPAIWRGYLDLAALHPRVDNLETLLKRAGPLPGFEADATYYQGLVEVVRSPQSALDTLRAAVKAGVKKPRAHIEMAKLLKDRGQDEAALAEYDAALALEPRNDLALSGKADLLRNLGRTEDALETARAAISARPKEGALYASYVSIRKVDASDPIIGQMKTLFRKKAVHDPSLGFLGHALAKAMEDTGQHGEVFRYLDRATKNIRARHPFDIAAEQTAMASIRDYWADLPPAEDATGKPTPIFVTGLPRSGTTLVEQIISSHSDVVGGGELGLLGPRINACLEDKAASPPERRTALRAGGEAFRADLAARFEGASHVTDKSISTVLTVGLVAAALPDCRIVVVRRDPRDNALSIYKNHFAEGRHRYSNDLEDIAAFMRLAETQLDFWREVCPDRFLEVRYEDVVADLESNAHAIIAHTGLPWQDACLDFHKNTRRVDTLSTAQVRQPIYASSVEAWRRYEDDLQPFIEAYEKLGGRL